MVTLSLLAEQHRIVAEVERRLSVVAEPEVTVAANLKRAERLRRSILKRVFEGRLAAQDTSDEPADLLLERVSGESECHRQLQQAAPRFRDEHQPIAAAVTTKLLALEP